MDCLRTIVVDDTVTYRILIAEALRPMAGVEVVGTAANGAIALERVRELRPDLVLLDLEMPVLDGFETLAVLRREFPGTGVIIVSGTDPESADRTLKALELGAFDFVEKPRARDGEEGRQFLRRGLEAAIENYVAGSRSGARPEAGARPSQRLAVAVARASREAWPPEVGRGPAPSGRVDVVLVAVSTGGPAALGQVIPRLPVDLPVAILVVQHMPAVFTRSLAESLQRNSRLEVREARPGDPVGPGQVLLAPGGRHMIAVRAGGRVQVEVEDSPPIKSCRPSADRLFETAVAAYGGRVLAVVMTGMGSDGLDGARAVKAAGGRCIAQDRETSTIPSMPLAVIEAGLADEVVPLECLAARIEALSKRPGA